MRGTLKTLAGTLCLMTFLGACSPAPAQPEVEGQDGGAEQAGDPATAAPAKGDLGGRELVVGTDATYEPFEYVDDSGKIVGVDPDIFAALCEVANCKASFEATAWDGIFAALKAKEFDVLMSSITILPERETESGAKFTIPYHSIGQVILVRDDEATITGADSLGEAVVGVQTGTTGDTAATETLKLADDKVKRFDSIALALQGLRNKDLDAVILDSAPAEKAAKDTAEPRLRIAGEPFTQEDYGILVPDSSPEVLEALNLAIEELKASGQLQAIIDRWMAD